MAPRQTPTTKDTDPENEGGLSDKQRTEVADLVTEAVTKALDGAKPAKVRKDKDDESSTVGLTIRDIERAQEEATRRAVAQLKEEEKQKHLTEDVERIKSEQEQHKPVQTSKLYRFLFGGS